MEALEGLHSRRATISVIGEPTGWDAKTIRSQPWDQRDAGTTLP